MMLNVGRARLILRPNPVQWFLDTGDALCALKSAEDAIKLLPYFPLRIIDESKTINRPSPVATAELIGDDTSVVSLRIDRNGQEAAFTVNAADVASASIDGVYGMYDDNWLDVEAMFSVCRAAALSFDVYIPDIPGGRPKNLNVIFNRGEKNRCRSSEAGSIPSALSICSRSIVS